MWFTAQSPENHWLPTSPCLPQNTFLGQSSKVWLRLRSFGAWNGNWFSPALSRQFRIKSNMVGQTEREQEPGSSNNTLQETSVNQLRSFSDGHFHPKTFMFSALGLFIPHSIFISHFIANEKKNTKNKNKTSVPHPLPLLLFIKNLSQYLAWLLRGNESWFWLKLLFISKSRFNLTL